MPRIQSIYTVLRVDPLNENRCCGLTKAGVPCNNIVARLSREQAYGLLSQCSSLPPSSRQLKANFRTAAGLILCKRWHQAQWPNILRHWIQAWEAFRDATDSGYGSGSEGDYEIEEVEEEVAEETRRSTSRITTARQTNVQVAKRSLQGSKRSATPFEYGRLIDFILSSGVSNDAKISLLQSAASSRQRSSNSSPNAAAHSTNTTRTGRQSSSLASTNRPRDSSISITSAAERNGTRSNSGSPSSSTQSSGTAPASPLPVVRSTTSTSRTAPPEPIRDSHINCYICLEPYIDDNPAHWECRQCRNRVHLSCHRLWAESSPLTTRCGYCRAVVPPLV